MEKTNAENLDEVLGLLIEEVKSSKKTEEEKQKDVDILVKLYQLRQNDKKLEIEERKVKNEFDEIRNKIDTNVCNNFNQLEEQKKDRIVKLAIDLTGIIVPAICYGIWFEKGLKFEKGEAFTSLMFRNLINRFKPTKN